MAASEPENKPLDYSNDCLPLILVNYFLKLCECFCLSFFPAVG